jgi:hypothetical protein
MKVEMTTPTLVVIGRHGVLPPLIPAGWDGGDILVLAVGPRVTPEQQRAVEQAVSYAVEHRVSFEARIASPADVARAVADASDPSTIRFHGVTRQDRRALGLSRG